MAFPRFSEEVIEMILSPLLRHPDEAFLDFGPDGWDRRIVVEPSVLCVCKQWLRIGTPLLYETVIIKTSSSMNTLAKLFTDNPAVAKTVKYLQISEFGNQLSTILASTSKVRSLCIAPYVHHTRSITGLIKAANNVSKVALAPQSLFIMKPHKGRYSFKCRTAVICTILLACEWAHLGRIEIENDQYLTKLFCDEATAQGAAEIEHEGKHVTIADEKCVKLVLDVLNKRLFDETVGEWPDYLPDYFNKELGEKIKNKRLTTRLLNKAY